MSYITTVLIALSLMAGWLTRDWYDEAQKEKQVAVAEKKVAAGEVKIIHDTQIITKVITHETDKCLNQPIPTDLLEQLQ